MQKLTPKDAYLQYMRHIILTGYRPTTNHVHFRELFSKTEALVGLAAYYAGRATLLTILAQSVRLRNGAATHGSQST